MNCLDDLDVLDYVEGRMAADAVVEVRRHLDGCSDCLGLVGQLTEVAAQASVDGLTLGRTISSGGMGVIVEAFDGKLERRIALKLPRLRDAEARRRFEREVKITARLQHPAIVPVYAAGTLGDGEPYYAMRLVDGESLDIAIQREPDLAARLSLVRVLTTVAGAIAYAHSHGILHRDIKPANVLIGRFGEVVVIDWGLARATEDADEPRSAGSHAPPGTSDDEARTSDGAVVGTPAYMSPEQARGEPIDERADVYALGALLYHVLRGAPPGRGGAGDLVAALSGAPRDLVAIVAQAMAPDAAQRYRTAAELGADLERFQTGQLVGAHDYSLGQLVRRWMAQHRAAIAVAAIALLVVFAIGAVSVARIIGAEHVADQERERALAHRADAEELMGFMLVDLRDKLLPLGKLELLDVVARKATTYYEQRSQGGDAESRALHAKALVNLGEVLIDRGDLPGALAAFRSALAIQVQLVAVAPMDVSRLRNLSICHERMGEVLSKQGDDGGALANYRAGLDSAMKVAALEPANLDRQADLSISHRWIGGVLLARGELPAALEEFRAALAISETIAAAAPGDPARQRSLSISRARIGDALLQAGDGPAALVEYRASLAIDEQLVALDPTNTTWQRGLLLGQQEVADVLRAQGDAAGALALYRSAKDVGDRLVGLDPTNATWKRDLETSRNRIGEVLEARGDLSGALAEYTAARAIAIQLAATDPTNPTWQRDLSVAHDKVATILHAQGNATGALIEAHAGLVIAEKLAAADPTDMALQRDLVVSHATLAEIHIAAHDGARAVAEYRTALTLADTLAAQTPVIASARSDLAEVHRGLAAVLQKQGDGDGALAEYRAALSLVEALAAEDPGNRELQTTREELLRAMKGSRELR